MKVSARPRRRLGSDLGSLAAVLSVPLGLLTAFPYESLGFVPSAPPRKGARCAFVALSAAQERRMLAAARSAWQVGAEGVRGLRTEMSSGDLPPSPMGEVLSVRSVRVSAAPPQPGYLPDPLPPSVGAARPSALPAVAAPSAPAPAFSREELLAID